MGFKWSLNPYMGCVHRCTFCYVRHFEHRADRPSDDRYGTSIRVKINVADVLRKELSRPSWKREHVAIGAATDPYQPAEGRYRLTRVPARARRGVDADPDHHARADDRPRPGRAPGSLRRADVAVTFSIPTLDEEVWRRTEPSTAHPRQRLRALKTLVDGGVRATVGMAPILPGISDRPEQLAEVVRAAREAGACGVWANVLFLRAGTKEHFLESLARDWPGGARALRGALREARLSWRRGHEADTRRGRRAGARARDPRSACDQARSPARTRAAFSRRLTPDIQSAGCDR